MKLELTPRQRKILWATVRSYIATAEPVGSKTLAQSYNFGVSTATIRNDLATLEQAGCCSSPTPLPVGSLPTLAIGFMSTIC
jgi:heat-inducible transcriptional repressor